jgi:hypothetical protein
MARRGAGRIVERILEAVRRMFGHRMPALVPVPARARRR